MEVITKNPLASDFAMLFQRIIALSKEIDGLREYYHELYKKIESGEVSPNEDDSLDLIKTFNVTGFVKLSITTAQAAQTAAIIANDVSLSRVFDPNLKATERALRHIESGVHR
jgi:hypothetical protein